MIYELVDNYGGAAATTADITTCIFKMKQNTYPTTCIQRLM